MTLERRGAAGAPDGADPPPTGRRRGRRRPARRRLRHAGLAARHAAAGGHADGLVRLAYLDDGDDEDAVLADLAAPGLAARARAPRRLDEPRRELDEYFAGRGATFDAAARLAADRAVRPPGARRPRRAIPYGAVVDLRRGGRAQAGSPRGVRAAGNALGANPLPIVAALPPRAARRRRARRLHRRP